MIWTSRKGPWLKNWWKKLRITINTWGIWLAFVKVTWTCCIIFSKFIHVLRFWLVCLLSVSSKASWRNCFEWYKLPVTPNNQTGNVLDSFFHWNKFPYTLQNVNNKFFMAKQTIQSTHRENSDCVRSYMASLVKWLLLCSIYFAKCLSKTLWI